MTRPQALRLGPFTGGINQYSDPSAIEDNELVDCINLEPDIDGSLVCRPVRRKANQTGQTWTDNIAVIGNGVWPNTVRLFASNASGLYMLDDRLGAWSKITSAGNNKFNAAIQVMGSVLFVPEVAGAGGYWNPTAGWIADSNIPRGRAGVYFKQRLWVVPGRNPPAGDESRLRFTDPVLADISAGAKPVWAAVNSIDISRGDGQDLVDVIVYQDQLMLFKQDSTYVLAYDTLPSEGLLRVVHTSVGATMRDCVATFEDLVYVLHQGRVYEIINYDFQHINVKCPFLIDGTIPAGTTDRTLLGTICVVEDRLVVNYFNRIYVFGLFTRTWSRYESVEPHLHNAAVFVPWPTNTLRDTPQYYYAGSSIKEYTGIIEWVEGRFHDVFESWDLVERLDINCKIITKNFDLGDSLHYKRLKWWGADVLCNTWIRSAAAPIVVGSGTTWGEASAFTWADLETWAQPLTQSIVEWTELVPEEPTLRKFIKFNKALRFRQIALTVEMTSDGSLVTGPCRLFYVTAVVGIKQVVVKQVS